jgi:nucleoside-diphosphate-sugar epimerase
VTRVAVVGANGRVGRAIVDHLRCRYEVQPVQRMDGEGLDDLAARAVIDAALVINAAGAAHLLSSTDADLERLRLGNVELPVTIARTALAHRTSLVHISSVKAELPDESLYARSKWEAERRLESFDQPFREADLALVVVRPLAMLFPPLNAGKVAVLQFVRFVPQALVPPIRLPVLAPERFLRAIDRAVDDAVSDRLRGLSVSTFEGEDRGTLRDVHRAFRQAAADSDLS